MHAHSSAGPLIHSLALTTTGEQITKFYLEASNLAPSNENTARVLMKVAWQPAESFYSKLMSEFFLGTYIRFGLVTAHTPL